jgi:FAD/FMN-containing dehydrogenase
MRAHGLACDNLISADVVTADGRLLTASVDEHPELFWGLRGGGGNFGVVTSLEYRLHPVGPTVFGGALFFAADRASDLLRLLRDWAPGTPEELGIVVGLTTAPPAPFVPEDFRLAPAAAMVVCFNGPTEEGEALLAPIRELGPRVDLLGPMPYTAIQRMFDESYPHGIRSYWKSGFLHEVDDDAIGALVGTVATRPSPTAQVLVEYMGGAPQRVGDDETAFGARRDPVDVLIMANWEDQSDDESHISWARNAYEAIQSRATGSVYVNYLGDEGDARIRAAYGDDHYERLASVKATYDPDNLFRLNQNIPPKR